MGLHELHKHAEWYPLTDTERTSVQRLAARTQGIVTPANVISVLGACLTIVALMLFYRHQYMWGVGLIGVGRLCDILDGHVARRTHTASPVGEGVDAFFDKVVVFIGCGLLIYMGVIPALLGVPLLMIQLVISILALLVRHDGTGLHPQRLGKYSMFGLWVAIGMFMTAYLLPAGSSADVTRAGAILLFVVVLIGELLALRQYIRSTTRNHLFNR